MVGARYVFESEVLRGCGVNVRSVDGVEKGSAIPGRRCQT